MDIKELIIRTKDVEKYKGDPVSIQEIYQIVEAFQLTPSAANTQPWEVYLIEDMKMKKLLDSCLLEPMLRGPAENSKISFAPVGLVIAIDRKRARARFGENGEKLYAVQDTAVAVNNLRLLATARGLGTTWLREVDLEKVAKVLNLPVIIRPVALVTVGYPLNIQQSPSSLRLEDIFHIINQ